VSILLLASFFNCCAHGPAKRGVAPDIGNRLAAPQRIGTPIRREARRCAKSEVLPRRASPHTEPRPKGPTRVAKNWSHTRRRLAIRRRANLASAGRLVWVIIYLLHSPSTSGRMRAWTRESQLRKH